jgi:hypothetical protein
MWLWRIFQRYHLNSVYCNLSDCLLKLSEKHGRSYEEDFGIIDSQVNKGFCEGLAKIEETETFIRLIHCCRSALVPMRIRIHHLKAMRIRIKEFDDQYL